MRILVSVALWGRSYAKTFAEYSLASMLAPNNIPRLAADHQVTYHIVTTRHDGAWLKEQPAIRSLQDLVRVEWDFLEDMGYASVPSGSDSAKYAFLSALQNLAIAKSLAYDALVFNYADFVWADGSLSNSVNMLSDGVDAVLSFCLPVDRDRGIRALDEHRAGRMPLSTSLELSPRIASDIAVRCLHREANLRYWDGPLFSITPTYLLWPVGKEGIVVRAYHQTILVIRVKPDDPNYAGGNPGLSLDGYFSAMLADSGNVVHASNSDAVMVFSLFATPFDSRLLGGRTREASLRECLRGTISQGQRKFARVAIEVRRSYDEPAAWTEVENRSLAILDQFHETTVFDPAEHERLYLSVRNTAEAQNWQRKSAFRKISARFYQDVILRFASSRFGRGLKQFLGPERIKGLRLKVDSLLHRERMSGDVPRAGKPPSLLSRQSLDSAIRGSQRFVWNRIADSLNRLIGIARLRTLRLDAESAVYRRQCAKGAAPAKLNPFLSSSRSGATDHVTLLRILMASLAAELVRGIRRRCGCVSSQALTKLADSPMGAALGRHRLNSMSRTVRRLGETSRIVAPNVRLDRQANLAFQDASSIERMIASIDDPQEMKRLLATAETSLRLVAGKAPLWAEAHRALGRNLWFQGRFDEALACFTNGESCLAQLTETIGWDSAAAVMLPGNCHEAVGLTGHIDAFVKHKLLSGDTRPYYLLARPEDIVNRPFLDYWARYITIITDPAEIQRLTPLEAAYGVNWNWISPDTNDGVIHIHRGIARIQRQWEREGRPALLKLNTDHTDLLARQRTAWGMQPADWFICLHVRSSGFYGEGRGTGQHFRNTRIEDYYPLIRSILAKGGWVVRMGDPSMPPLDLAACGEGRGRIIDYAHAAERTPSLDVALSAACRLFVSSPSGLHTVAHAFGRPVCPVNFPIYAGFPWHPEEIFIPQKYFSRHLVRLLTFEEILSSDIPHRDHHWLLENADLELVHDSPIDLVEVVAQALDPKGYVIADLDIGRRVIEEFERLNQQYNVDISGRIGLHFAASYAAELCPVVAGGTASSGLPLRSIEPLAVERKLDVLVPSYNRPQRLFHLLATGLALDIPGMCFVVFDDASSVVEDIPGLGLATTAQVCASFHDKRVIYIRNPENMGVAASWQRYYSDFSAAPYTMSVTDKDEFIDAAPIISALAKLDADPGVSMVVIPLRQKDRTEDDRLLTFDYKRMSGKDYIARYVMDTTLQHCSMWGILRVDAMRRAGVPRSMNIRQFGLDDGFGIDIDVIFMVATIGGVDFESKPHVRRSTLAGGTENYPLTFAYTYYQYAKRVMAELHARGSVSEAVRRHYISWWLLLILRGLVVAYRPVYGTELERGTNRIRRHLRMPIFFYLPMEAARYGIKPKREHVRLYGQAAVLSAFYWFRVWRSRLIGEESRSRQNNRGIFGLLVRNFFSRIVHQ